MAIYPDVYAGQRITAALLDSMQPIIARKTVNEAVTSSTTFQNDDELFLPVVANGVYLVELFVLYDAATVADIKLQWSLPSGASFSWAELGMPTGSTDPTLSTVTVARKGTSSTSSWGGGGATGTSGHAQGTLTVSSTAGNIQLQWAQVSSSGTATNVTAGSWLRLTRIA